MTFWQVWIASPSVGTWSGTRTKPKCLCTRRSPVMCCTKHIRHVLKWVLCTCRIHCSSVSWFAVLWKEHMYISVYIYICLYCVALSSCLQAVSVQSSELAEAGRKRRRSANSSQRPSKTRRILNAPSPQKTDSGIEESQFSDLSFLPGSIQWSQTLDSSDLLKHIKQLIAEVAEVTTVRCYWMAIAMLCVLRARCVCRDELCNVLVALCNVLVALCNVLVALCAGYQPFTI